jgi:hypothetical protein
MFIRSRENFILLENIKQAKEYLSNVELEERDKQAFNKIIDKLKKTPNLVDTFTRMLFPNKIEIGDNKYKVELDYHLYEEVLRLINWINNNKNIINQLPKNITKYKDYEELSDDIVQLNKERKIDGFIKSLYRSMKNEIERLDDENLKKFRSIVLEFVELPEDLKKNIPPLKYFEMNNVSLKEFISIMNKTILNQGNEYEEKIRKYVKENNIKISYDKDGVLVIQTNNKKEICDLGSDSWCIVYSPEIYHRNYIGNTSNTQYLVFNFNLPVSNPNSMFGITINTNGKVFNYGTCQNRLNSYVDLNEVKKMTGIPDNILISKYTELINKIKKSGVTNVDDIVTKEELKKWALKHNEIDINLNYLGININYSHIIQKLGELFNNYIEIFNFFEETPNTLKAILDQLLRVFKENKKHETYKIKFDDINKLEKEYIKDILSSNTQITTHFLYNFCELSDILPICIWLKLEIKFNNYGIRLNFIIDTIEKYGFDYLIKLIKSDVKLFSKIMELEDNMSDKSYNKNIIKERKLSIKQYKEIFNLIKNYLHNDNELMECLAIYLYDSDIVELLKIGEGLINIQRLTSQAKEVYIEYLASLDIKDIIDNINKNSKSQKYKRGIENIILTTSSSKDIPNKIFDYITNSENVIMMMLDYKNLIEALPRTFNSKTIIKKYINKNLETCLKILYTIFDLRYNEIVDEIISNSDFNNQQLINIYNNIEDISNDIIEIYKHIYINNQKNVPSNILIKNSLNQLISQIITKIIDSPGNFPSFNDYLGLVESLKPITSKIYNEYLSGQYGLIFNKIQKIIKNYTEKKSNDLEELRKFILEYGKYSKIFPLDLLDDSRFSVEYFTKPYLKFVGAMLNENDEKDDSIAMFAKYLNGDLEKEVYLKQIGLEKDPETEQWCISVSFEDITDLYDLSESAIKTLDLQDIWYFFYDHGHWYPNIEDLLNDISFGNLFELSTYLYNNGFTFLDLSVFDKYNKYIKNSESNIEYYYYDIDYKTSQNLFFDDRGLRSILSRVEEILTENIDEDDYDDFDLDEAYSNIDLNDIKSCFESAWGSIDNDLRAYKWWDSSISNMHKILHKWENQNNSPHKFLKWDEDGERVKIIPNIDLLEFDDNISDLLYNISEYTSLNSYKALDILKSYVITYEGGIKLSEDDGNTTWEINNYIDYNDLLSDKLSEIIELENDYLKDKIVEKNIFKFEEYKREN